MKNLFQVNSSAVILNDKNQVLLAKRSMDEDVYPGLWGIPGGKLDNTDACLEDGLRREIREEVGIEISDIKLIESHAFCTEELNKVYLHFSARYVSGEPQPLEDTEKVHWFNLDNLPREDEFTPHARKVVVKILSQ
jgi:mutator protein MutT